MPSPTSASLPSIPAPAKDAWKYFGGTLDFTPPAMGDVEGQTLDRP